MKKKILLVADSKGWAIDRLCQVLVKYNSHFDIRLVYYHARDAERKLEEFQKLLAEFKPDLIQWDYFRTAGRFLQLDPSIGKYPSIVHHHNQQDKALYMFDFLSMGVKKVVVHNRKAVEMLASKGWTEGVVQIPLGIDPKYWQFREKEPETFTAGYAGRICAWKNAGLIAEATHELGVPMMLMGKMDDPNYWDTIQHKEHMDFSFWECTDEQRPDFYKNLGCYVGASDDSRESGTLELLESMASGVPVITTLSGIARDICEDGKNCLVVPFNDQEAIKAAIAKLRDDPSLRKELADNAWNTVKNYTEEKYAMRFSKLWYEVLGNGYTLASIVIPTYNRSKELEEVLAYFENEEDYPHFEVIVVDDNSTDKTPQKVAEAMARYSYPIKYINTHRDGYNLAMARNLGVIAAEGEVVVFCDSRIKPEPGAIFTFVECCEHAGEVEGGNRKKWFFGNKDGAFKKSFVENFSAVRRDYLIEAGMFNERIDRYGGMSQELRTRWGAQGGELFFIETANAKTLCRSGMSTQRRNDIVEMKMLLYKLYGEERH